MKTWILVRQVIDGANRPPEHSMAVAIQGRHIVDIQPQSRLNPDPADKILDEGEAVLTPGLVDCHVHLTFTHGPDHSTTRAKVETAPLPALVLVAARNAQMCLCAGITTVRDCGDRGMVTCYLRDAIAQRWLAGPRILASGVPITTTGGHLYWCGGEADTVAEVRTSVRRLCKSGVDWVKIVASGGNMTVGSNPLAPQYSVEELAAAVEEAHRLGRKVAAHTLNAETNRRAVAAGIDTLEHCAWNTPAGVPQYDAAVAEEIARRSMWVSITMAGIDRILLPDPGDTAEASEEKLAAFRERHRDTRRMRDTGVGLIISSDAGVRYTRFEDFALSLVCAVEGLAISPVEALHRATQVPAQALGLGDEIGSIEVGKRADLVVIDGDPATQISDMRKVRRVWRDGCVVLEGANVALPAATPLELP